MTFLRLAILSAALVVDASAADINGTWNADFVGPAEDRPHTVDKMVFELKSDGTNISGTAHIGSWPGDITVTEGKIESNRISFTVVGTGAWTSHGPNGAASGYPRLTFSGTVNGKGMKLKLVWDSVMIYGTASPPREWVVVAGKD